MEFAEALWAATPAAADRLAAAPGQAKGTPEEIAAIRAMLGRGPGGIERVLREHGFSRDRDLLLLVDQFEELFRFESLGGDAEVASFIDQLIDVFDGQPHGIHVVSTMRADFIADCARWPRLAGALNRSAYLLRWMTEGELREAITAPARLYRGEIEPKLVDRIIQDAGGKPDQLPVIQHALMWMWDRAGKTNNAVLTLHDYEGEDVGGLDGALSRHADQIYNELAVAAAGGSPRDLRPIARRVFQSLTDIDANGRAIRRPCQFGELRAVAGCEASDLQYVLDQFRKPGCSFLMPDEMRELKDTDPVDVSHEALIRQWTKMRVIAGETNWVEEEKQDADTWRALAREAGKFAHNPRRRLARDQNSEFQDWWKSRRPTAAWVTRYSPDASKLFGKALDLLSLSARHQRRLKAARWAGVAAVVVAVLGGIGSTAFLIGAQNLQEVENQRQELDTKRKLLEKELATARRQQAVNEWRSGDALVLMHKTLVHQSDSTGEATAYRALTRHFLLREFEGAWAADWTPDGLIAALADGNRAYTADLLSGKVRASFNLGEQSVYNVAISPDGRYVVIGYESADHLAIWDAASGKEVTRLPVNGQTGNLYFSPDGKWLGVSDSDTVLLVDTSNWTVSHQWEGALDPGYLVFAHDSARVVSLSYEGDVEIVSLLPPFNHEYEETLETPSGFPAFDRTRPWLAVPMQNGTLRLIDYKMSLQNSFLYENEYPTAVSFSRDGQWLAVGTSGGRLDILEAGLLEGNDVVDPKSWKAVQETSMRGGPRWLQFSPDGRQLLADTADGAVLVVDPHTNRTNAVLRASTGIAYPTFTGNGRHVISMGDDKIFRVWNLTPARVPESFAIKGRWNRLTLHATAKPGERGSRSLSQSKLDISTGSSVVQVLGLVYNGPAPSLLVRSQEGIALHHVGSPEPVFILQTKDQSAILNAGGALSFASNGAMVVAADSSGAISTFSVASSSWTQVAPSAPGLEDGTQISLGVKPDAGVLAVVGGSIHMHEADGTASNGETVDSKDKILAVDAARRQLLTTVSELNQPRAIRLYSIATGKGEDLPLRDSSDEPVAGALSSDGKFAAVTQKSGLVDVWDLERRVLVATMGEGYHKLLMPAFPPDGNAVDVVGEDGTIHRWTLYPDRASLVREIERAIGVMAADEKKVILEYDNVDTVAP